MSKYFPCLASQKSPFHQALQAVLNTEHTGKMGVLWLCTTIGTVVTVRQTVATAGNYAKACDTHMHAVEGEGRRSRRAGAGVMGVVSFQ